MAQPGWEMGEESLSSVDSGPHSPVLTEEAAFFKAKIAEKEAEIAASKQKYDKMEIDFHKAYQELVNENNELRDELSKKNSEIGSLRDLMREMSERLSKLEKKDSRNEKENMETLNESSSNEDSDFEIRRKRSKKRKGKNSPSLENKMKKSNETNEEEDIMVIENEVPKEYNENFPPIKAFQGRNNLEKSESVVNGPRRQQNQESGVSKFKNNNNVKPSQPRIPPIVLRDKSRYSALTAEFAARKISFERATTLPEGVRIQPSTSDDFRKMTRVMEEKKVEFHSYQLAEDKLLHVVLRGVLESFTEQEIGEDLKGKGFNPKKIVRFKFRDGNPMPMVLVLVPKEDKGIFNIKDIKQNSIKVEAQKTRARSTQCFNCQMFGHSSFGCRAKPRCVKCGAEHPSKTCNVNKEQGKAKCANCGGNHPASFAGCPKHPKHQAEQLRNVPQRKDFRWGSQDNGKLAANPENMGAAMNTINMMNAAMQQFMKNLQKMQEQFASTFMGGTSMTNTKKN